MGRIVRKMSTGSETHVVERTLKEDGRPDSPPADDVPWEGPKERTFTKGIRDVLVKGVPALLRSSVVASSSPGLIIGDTAVSRLPNIEREWWNSRIADVGWQLVNMRY